ncbi:hypothetical protein A3K86_18410 [Photobacterium jeanii]|uniref:Lcl C-terminal domain-containing protein n=1 Tax=Photobacterium jeanii TaxID=858640 RepID=A0A178K1H9_9GAMM|nr:DUF1566 domain-containing protein [Photobacterium jeanii]OAN10957.1 hypothetical protein A3K86_18410 [Photobacterium jeanii]PST90472.1 DUF1566 domain-containing protein [Photobacterium jeanii]
MKKTVTSTLITALFALMTTNAMATSQECDLNLTKSAPDVRFKDNNDGTVTDLRTDLVWRRCALGQTWNKTNNVCEGKVTGMYWQAALQRAEIINNDVSDPLHQLGGRQEWRLPNIKELQSLRESSCVSPAVNKRFFPLNFDYLSLESTAWSSTPSYSNKGNILTVGMGDGLTTTFDASSTKLGVLLVSSK